MLSISNPRTDLDNLNEGRTGPSILDPNKNMGRWNGDVEDFMSPGSSETQDLTLRDLGYLWSPNTGTKAGLEDLDRAIERNSQALQRHDKTHGIKKTNRIRLVNLLGYRFRLSKAISDLDRIISEANGIKAYSNISATEYIRLARIEAKCLHERYKATGHQSALSGAIDLANYVVDLTMPREHYKAARYDQLAELLCIRFQRHWNNIEDLNNAIYAASHALHATSKDDKHFTSRKSNLAYLRSLVHEKNEEKGVLSAGTDVSTSSKNELEQPAEEVHASRIYGIDENGESWFSDLTPQAFMEKSKNDLEQTVGSVEHEDEQDGDSIVSSHTSFTFDNTRQSKSTNPTTMLTSQTPGDENYKSGQSEGAKEGTKEMTKREDDTENSFCRNLEADEETEYSVLSTRDEINTGYIQAFSKLLLDGISTSATLVYLPDIPSKYFDTLFKTFALKLHAESSTPFQWETSVLIHRKRKKIIEEFTDQVNTNYITENSNGSISTEESDVDEPERVPQRKSPEDMDTWLRNVEASDHNVQESQESQSSDESDIDPIPDSPEPDIQVPEMFQLKDYENFIKSSKSYSWLLYQVVNYNHNIIGDADMLFCTGKRVREWLRVQAFSKKMSRQRPSQSVQMAFEFGCSPGDSALVAFDKMICLTGSPEQAHSTTIKEYMQRIWPETGNLTASMFQKTLSLQKVADYAKLPTAAGIVSTYTIPPEVHSVTGTKFSTDLFQGRAKLLVTGDIYAVSEAADQLGWLASAVAPAPLTCGVVTCQPKIESIQPDKPKSSINTVVASCTIGVHFDEDVRNEEKTCIPRVHPALVRGYPITRTPPPKPARQVLKFLDEYTEQNIWIEERSNGDRSLYYQTWASLRLRFARLTRPRVPIGRKRITWICGCGKPMYADVEEQIRGGAESLQAELRQSAAEAADQRSTNTSTTTLAESSSSTQKTPTERSEDTSSGINERSSSNTQYTNTPDTQSGEESKRYLLLIVKGPRFPILKQVELASGDDRIFFQDIRKAYKELKFEKRHINPDIPRFIEVTIEYFDKAWVEAQRGVIALLEKCKLRWAVWWLDDNVFWVPKSADFVQFELLPIKSHTSAEVLNSKVVPPEDEVLVKKNYHYHPCPPPAVITLEMPHLHVLFEPGHCLYKFWVNRTPKKLRSKLSEPNGQQPVIGWGLQIKEGFNWSAALFVLIVVLLLSFVVGLALTYTVTDVSGGFAVAAFIATAASAVWAMLIMMASPCGA